MERKRQPSLCLCPMMLLERGRETALCRFISSGTFSLCVYGGRECIHQYSCVKREGNRRWWVGCVWGCGGVCV